MADADEFDDFVAARWSRLTRTAYVLGAREGQAEDIVQTALLDTWRRWPKVRASANPDGYVYRTLVNALKRSRRRRWVGETSTGLLPQPEADSTVEPDVDLRVDVRRLLAALPLEQRVVLVLRFLEDRSEAEVADLLGLPIGTVKSRASRALAKLAALTADYERSQR